MGSTILVWDADASLAALSAGAASVATLTPFSTDSQRSQPAFNIDRIVPKFESFFTISGSSKLRDEAPEIEHGSFCTPPHNGRSSVSASSIPIKRVGNTGSHRQFGMRRETFFPVAAKLDRAAAHSHRTKLG